MRAWLPPSLLLLLIAPGAAALGEPSGLADILEEDCYIPYPGPDETHGNPFGGDEGFFVVLVPAAREGDQAGSEEYGYGIGMTGCEIDPWGWLVVQAG